MESRMETYLNAAISGNTENLPQPISRIDYLLCELIKTINESTEKINELVTEKINEIVADAPENLDTLKEISDAINTLTETVGRLEDEVNKNVEIMPALFDTSSMTNMYYMFKEQKTITSIPLYDTSNVTQMNQMFYECYSLKTIPALDTSRATSMDKMFNNCYSLESVPELDTSNVTSMQQMFNQCHALKTVSGLDMNKCTSNNCTIYMFENCRSLTNCYLYNIRCSLTVGAGTSWGHLLTLESLLHMIKELIDTGSSKTFTVGTANLEKLANVYVRLIEITDEMRAEDEFIDSKLPFEVCESTDEGAQLITSYVTSKNWVLK